MPEATEEILARPQVGDPVWDIQDDPSDHTQWSKITRVVTTPEEEYATDGVWAVEIGYGHGTEEVAVVFRGLEGTLQTWEVV